jgi:hypothetical protein
MPSTINGIGTHYYGKHNHSSRQGFANASHSPIPLANSTSASRNLGMICFALNHCLASECALLDPATVNGTGSWTRLRGQVNATSLRH